MSKDLALTVFRALVMIARAIAREYGFPWPPKGDQAQEHAASQMP